MTNNPERDNSEAFDHDNAENDPNGNVPMKIPNPGSREAIDIGCVCPTLDNGHGKGAWMAGGSPAFWISGACPVHGKKDLFSELENGTKS